MLVSEMADGDRGYVHPWDAWREPDGQWFINGRAKVVGAGRQTAMPIERRDDAYFLAAEDVVDYGFADDPALLGPDIEPLPCVVSTEVEALVSAARG